MFFRNNLLIDYRRANERNPPIESERLLRSATSVYHANIGLEIDLMKRKTIETRKYKDVQVFFFAAVGYSYGRHPVQHLDVSQAVVDENALNHSENNYMFVESKEIDFSVYLPERESLIRHFSVTLGFSFRI